MKFLRPSFLLLGIFVLGGIIFKATTPNECDQILSNDSIFVLTGDFRRVPFALHQRDKFPYSDLYIIGTPENSSYQHIENAIIESNSKTTYQNAVAIRDIVKKSNLDRIVLITTEDHIRRAYHLVKHEIPDTVVISCPVALSEMPPARRLERWTIEYMKYLFTLIGIKESPNI